MERTKLHARTTRKLNAKPHIGNFLLRLPRDNIGTALLHKLQREIRIGNVKNEV